MRDLIIAISNLDNLQYLFLRYLIIYSDAKGSFLFDKPSMVFEEGVETPNYAIRKVGGELFRHPVSFSTHQNNLHIRLLSIQSVDASQPYFVQLSSFVVRNREYLKKLFLNGALDSLRLLDKDESKLLLLKVNGRLELSEGEVRNLMEEGVGRFSNIIERKLKPSLNELSNKLNIHTAYATRRKNGVATITIELINKHLDYEQI